MHAHLDTRSDDINRLRHCRGDRACTHCAAKHRRVSMLASATRGEIPAQILVEGKVYAGERSV
eukprot:scaffold10121_cov112-Isochrysis_galbana.AAC.3